MNLSVGGPPTFDVVGAIGKPNPRTEIQTIQSERVRLLDMQMVDVTKSVQLHTDQILKLNNVLSGLNAYSAQIEGKSAGDKPRDWGVDKMFGFELPVNDAIQAAGITDLGFRDRLGQRTPGPGEQADGGVGKLVSGTNVVTGSTTKGEIEAAITTIKGMINVVRDNQQIEMVRLQNLNMIKNQTVDVLTNLDSRLALLDSKLGGLF
ncbi:MAG: hypothetical protein JHC61_06585 [Burkholderiaceae bacterium]|mgnify:CR=1 FL=1|nr:hypothetical protein [Burkholderiaceae bacterium]